MQSIYKWVMTYFLSDSYTNTVTLGPTCSPTPNAMGGAIFLHMADFTGIRGEGLLFYNNSEYSERKRFPVCGTYRSSNAGRFLKALCITCLVWLGLCCCIKILKWDITTLPVNKITKIHEKLTFNFQLCLFYIQYSQLWKIFKWTAEAFCCYGL